VAAKRRRPKIIVNSNHTSPAKTLSSKAKTTAIVIPVVVIVLIALLVLGYCVWKKEV
jgi:hypothetical protein